MAWENTKETVARAGTDSWRETNVAITNTGKALEKAGQDTRKAIEKACQDTGTAVDKACQDVGGELSRVDDHVGDTLKALYTYNVNYLDGLGDAVSDAEVRLRSGKFVDAVWHLSFAPVTSSEKAAAQAALDSTYLRTIGSLAATTYGGPQGAAAYAAWLTYRQTGDLSLAVRTGVISGLSAAAFSSAGEMPKGSAYDTLKRTIVTAAIGGAGVAAAGGDTEAIVNGMLMSGGMVVIQDAYVHYMSQGDTGVTRLDPTATKNVPPYCFRGEVASLPGTSCTPLPAKYREKLPDGSYKIRVIDPRDLDPKVPQVGLKEVVLTKNPTTFQAFKDAVKVQFSEQGTVMEGLSKVPGVQAGAMLHDTWHMSWSPPLVLQATFVPAFAISYYGTVAPIQEEIRETALEKAIRTRQVFAETPQTIPLETTPRPAELQAQVIGASTTPPSQASVQVASPGTLQSPVGYEARRKDRNHVTGTWVVNALLFVVVAWVANRFRTRRLPRRKRSPRRKPANPSG